MTSYFGCGYMTIINGALHEHFCMDIRGIILNFIGDDIICPQCANPLTINNDDHGIGMSRGGFNNTDCYMWWCCFKCNKHYESQGSFDPIKPRYQYLIEFSKKKYFLSEVIMKDRIHCDAKPNPRKEYHSSPTLNFTGKDRPIEAYNFISSYKEFCNLT